VCEQCPREANPALHILGNVRPRELAPLRMHRWVLDPCPVADWRGSSFDLLNGVEVLDQKDSIPDELLGRVFKRP